MNQHYSQALGLTRLILMDGKAKRVWLRLAKRMSVDLATVFTCNKRCFGHKVMAINLFWLSYPIMYFCCFYLFVTVWLNGFAWWVIQENKSPRSLHKHMFSASKKQISYMHFLQSNFLCISMVENLLDKGEKVKSFNITGKLNLQQFHSSLLNKLWVFSALILILSCHKLLKVYTVVTEHFPTLNIPCGGWGP